MDGWNLLHSKTLDFIIMYVMKMVHRQKKNNKYQGITRNYFYKVHSIVSVVMILIILF